MSRPEMTDAALRQRALTAPAPRSPGGHACDPRLAALIAAVDRFDGNPTEEDIRRLAWKYREIPSRVRLIFETRADRRLAAARVGPTRLDAWTDTEIRLIRSMWQDRNGESVHEWLQAVASALNRLPGNVARGVTRTPGAVNQQRRDMGLVGDRGRASARHLATSRHPGGHALAASGAQAASDA